MYNIMRPDRYAEIHVPDLMGLYVGDTTIPAVVLDAGLSPADALALSFGIEERLREKGGKGYVIGDEETEGTFSSMIQEADRVIFHYEGDPSLIVPLNEYREALAQWSLQVHHHGRDFASTESALEIHGDLLARGEAVMAGMPHDGEV